VDFSFEMDVHASQLACSYLLLRDTGYTVPYLSIAKDPEVRPSIAPTDQSLRKNRISGYVDRLDES